MKEDSLALRACFDEGARQWPTLKGSWLLFQQMLEGTEHAGDCFLAAACASGEEEALRLFIEQYDKHLRAIVGSMHVSDDVRREALQLVQTRLFVSGGDTTPKIYGYRGRGPLLAFTRVVAVRTVQELARKTNRLQETSDEKLPGLADSSLSPEMAYLKRYYSKEFGTAFAQAIEKLTPRERTILRYAVVDGLSIDRLAAIYGQHRATVARQVSKARLALVKGTKQELMRNLDVDPSTLESILRLVDTSVEVSVQRLLA